MKPSDEENPTPEASCPRVKIIETTPDTAVVQIMGAKAPVTYKLVGDWGTMDLENPLRGCLRCEHNKIHGWIGPPGTDVAHVVHCRQCHRDWPDPKGESPASHCTRCCRHFKSERAFEYHWKQDGCADPATLKRKDGNPRLVEKSTPFGSIWTRWDPREPPSKRPGFCLPVPDEGPDDGDGGAAALPVPRAEAGGDDEELEAA